MEGEGTASGVIMQSDNLDITSMMTWEEGIPRPQWELIESWVESRDDFAEGWNIVCREWLTQIAKAVDPKFALAESDEFLILAPNSESAAGLNWFAEKCWVRMRNVLGSVAQPSSKGKHVVVAFQEADDYFRYISPSFPEGEHGSTAGLQIREGYSHIVLHGQHQWMMENVLAHESTHAALQHLEMPQWIEEGLAQMFEHDMTGRGLLELDAEIAQRHKRYWTKHGMDEFWRGEGFSRAGKVQELTYQLAEILMRLLVEDARPRWFGWVREPQQRFFLFLQEANEVDCGEEACRECLGFELRDLAARFLGEGDWSPSL